MKSLTVIALSLGLASTPLAFAEQAKPADAKAKPQAVKMSDAQLDKVTAGAALIDVILVDVVDVERVQVSIPVNASIAIAALGAAAGAVATQTRPGRQVQ